MTTSETKSADFVISRVLDAPRDLVWKAFTDPERMRQWWGPKGFSVIASKMDLRPGGTYHYGLKAPDGSPMWGKFVFREIVAPERMVFINSFSDEAGGTTRHPMAPTWPLEMLSTFTLRGATRRQDQAHDPLGAVQCHGRRAQDVRCRPGQHDEGLGRHAGATRGLPGEGALNLRTRGSSRRADLGFQCATAVPCSCCHLGCGHVAPSRPRTKANKIQREEFT